MRGAELLYFTINIQAFLLPFTIPLPLSYQLVLELPRTFGMVTTWATMEAGVELLERRLDEIIKKPDLLR